MLIQSFKAMVLIVASVPMAVWKQLIAFRIIFCHNKVKQNPKKFDNITKLQMFTVFMFKQPS